VAGLLEQVGLEPAFADRHPHELSGGQRQRVAIARAPAAEPGVLICDEVTSALDPDTGRSIMDLLTGLRERHGMTLVLISHDLPLIADRTDTVTVLEAGRVVESGRTADFFHAPAVRRPGPCWARTLPRPAPDERDRPTAPAAIRRRAAVQRIRS
jgi:peptide/nickel transport system ATP-binding protein